MLHLLSLSAGNRLTACAVQGFGLDEAKISTPLKEAVTSNSYEPRGYSLQV